MQLTVTQNGKLVNKAQFVKGPVHIGRHPQSQIFLPHHSVSRQHLVIFLGKDVQWTAKDLNSANKTYVNGKAINKAHLKTGDYIKVGDYAIDVDLDDGEAMGKSVHLEDTHAPVSRHPKIITRELEDKHAPAIRVPAHRAEDLYKLTFKVAHAGNSADTLDALLDLLIEQFQAYRAWCAFRYDPKGFAEEEGGRTHRGEPFVLQQESTKRLIDQACENQQYFLLSHIKQSSTQSKEQSAIIAPILAPGRILGEIYLDSKPGYISFSMSDLDYAMLVSINLAVILNVF